jgi:general secretion pathway protein D
MNHAIVRALAALTLFLLPLRAAEAPIEHLDLRNCDAGSAARLLASLTGEKVIATDTAKKQTVDLLLENATLEDSLKAMCRSAGLVYRFDGDSRIYTIMGLEEYQRGALNEAEGLYETKVFKVAAANLNQIAYSLESLFGDRVLLTEGEPVEDFRQDLSGGGLGGFGSTSGFNNSGIDSTDFNRSGQQTSFNTRGLTGGGSNSFNRRDRSSLSGRGGRGFGEFGEGAGAQQRSNLAPEAALALESARSEAGTSATPAGREHADDRERRARASTQNIIYVTTNPEHSLLVVRTADRAAIKEITELVANLDRAVPQVILEMKVLQLDVGDGLKAGTSWQINEGGEQFGVTARDSQTGLPTAVEFLGNTNNLGLGRFATETAATFAYEYISEQLRARVDMLANDNRVEVIATPVLIATNNRAAQIEVGEQRIITVGASTESTVAGETGTRNDFIIVETEQRTIGTTLRIIPRINDDRTVTLFVQQESTTLKPKNNSIQVGTEVVPIDSVDTANINATVVGKDGHTVAIGGLIRNEQSDATDKVPFLGDIPLLGYAFKRKQKTARKTELVLLITPRILDGAARADAVTHGLNSRLSDHRYHLGGEALVERDNPELSRYRLRAGESYDRMLVESRPPAPAAPVAKRPNWFQRTFGRKSAATPAPASKPAVVKKAPAPKKPAATPRPR